MLPLRMGSQPLHLDTLYYLRTLYQCFGVLWQNGGCCFWMRSVNECQALSKPSQQNSWFFDFLLSVAGGFSSPFRLQPWQLGLSSAEGHCWIQNLVRTRVCSIKVCAVNMLYCFNEPVNQCLHHDMYITVCLSSNGGHRRTLSR